MNKISLYFKLYIIKYLNLYKSEHIKKIVIFNAAIENNESKIIKKKKRKVIQTRRKGKQVDQINERLD